MKLTAPIRHLSRMHCKCFLPDGFYNTGASLSGDMSFEVEDDVKQVLYTAQNAAAQPAGQWIWDGKDWLGVDTAKGAAALKKAEKPAPVKIDPKLWAAAEKFTADFEKELDRKMEAVMDPLNKAHKSRK